MKYIEKVFFTNKKAHYKGNLHLHSTISDGKYSQKEMINIYKDRGYDFVAISDHRTYVNTTEYNEEDFVVINAFEMTSECKETNKLFHIHGIVDESLPVNNNSFNHLKRMPEPKYETLATTQHIIDDMREGGMLIMLNHPAWSHNSFEELLILHNYFAVEIYNHKAEVRNGNGSSVAHWDYLLRKGRKLWGIASDDSHDKSQKHKNGQYFGGWIVVNSRCLDTQSIVEAIKLGQFYSSTGPEFEEIVIEDDCLVVRCKEVKKIKFLTGCLRRDYCVLDLDNEDVIEGRYKIQSDEKYIRIELVDDKGMTAWSNPIYIEELRKDKVFIGV